MVLKYGVLPAALLGCLLLAGCQSTGTIDQAMYDACVAPYNREFRTKPASRAMVTGSGYSSTRCFWVWGQQTQQQAEEMAFANCRREKGLCYLFANNSGMTRWVRRISDNGGRDPGGSMSGDEERFASPTTTYQAPQAPRTSSPPPTTAGGGGTNAYTCFDRRQNAIAAQFQPRVNAAVGICQAAHVSRDMWQAVVDAAIQCNMPAAAISELRLNVTQSQATANASCVR